MRDEYDISNLNPRRNFHIIEVKDKKIENTFQSDIDSLYTAENMDELEKCISDVHSDESVLQEQGLIEAK